jgi:type III secretion protein J
MMRRFVRLGCIVIAVSLLGGCKIELYGNLPESEANRMLALLMLHHIDAEKKTLKGDTATIRVEEAQFVNAVELLRQNGLPRKRPVTVQDLFPPGQLVTSPAQEQAKIIYLKEQGLDNMLRSMDGVIDAQVTIAESPSANRYDPPTPSASVFVKYSPDRNLENRETEIRELILKGVPGLTAEHISVVMQRADYRYLVTPPRERTGDALSRAPTAARRAWLVALLAAALLVIAGAAVFALRRRRKHP